MAVASTCCCEKLCESTMCRGAGWKSCGDVRGAERQVWVGASLGEGASLSSLFSILSLLFKKRGHILHTTVLKVLSLVSFLPSPKITRNFLHRSGAETDFIYLFNPL